MGTHSGALLRYPSQGFVFLVQPSLKSIHQTQQLCSEFARKWFDSSVPFDWWVGGGGGSCTVAYQSPLLERDFVQRHKSVLCVMEEKFSGFGINIERTAVCAF